MKDLVWRCQSLATLVLWPSWAMMFAKESNSSHCHIRVARLGVRDFGWWNYPHREYVSEKLHIAAVHVSLP